MGVVISISLIAILILASACQDGTGKIPSKSPAGAPITFSVTRPTLRPTDEVTFNPAPAMADAVCKHHYAHITIDGDPYQCVPAGGEWRWTKI